MYVKDVVCLRQSSQLNSSDVLSEPLRLVVGPELDPVVEDGAVEGGELGGNSTEFGFDPAVI